MARAPQPVPGLLRGPWKDGRGGWTPRQPRGRTPRVARLRRVWYTQGATYPSAGVVPVRILLSNDDGIYSPGLWAAVAAVRDLGQPYVVAPDREQSGVGTCVTLHHPVRATPVAPMVAGVPTWAVEGTPADSVILALEMLVGPVDLVISGINQGANLGEDVLVSGTVGAALQGYVRHTNALAISVTAIQDVHTGAAAWLLRHLAVRLGEDSLPRPILLNINLPNVPLEQLQGIEVTELGQRSWMEVVREGEDGRRKYYWISRNRPVHHEVEGTDVWAVRRQRVSITPLHTRLTFHDAVPPLREVVAEVARGLRPAAGEGVGEAGRGPGAR